MNKYTRLFRRTCGVNMGVFGVSSIDKDYFVGGGCIIYKIIHVVTSM